MHKATCYSCRESVLTSNSKILRSRGHSINQPLKNCICWKSIVYPWLLLQLLTRESEFQANINQWVVDPFLNLALRLDTLGRAYIHSNEKIIWSCTFSKYGTVHQFFVFLICDRTRLTPVPNPGEAECQNSPTLSVSTSYSSRVYLTVIGVGQIGMWSFTVFNTRLSRASLYNLLLHEYWI